MPANVPHQHLLDRKATLETKLEKLKSGALKAEVKEGDGRQDEAIARTESQLRELNTAIAEAVKSQNAPGKQKS